MSNELLTVADIADVRAYERDRDAFRERIIERKAVRRVHVGTIVSLVFEDAETIRFQVQEMARAERIVSDEGIQAELDVYNPLISRNGRLTATLFIECTTDEQMREWFPKLVGIERSVELRVGEGDAVTVVRCAPESSHEAQLTREEITSAVHYIHFDVGQGHAEAFREGPVELAVTHPAYRESTTLSPGTRQSLAEAL